MKQKQFVALFLALVLAFSMLSLTALADAAPTITVVGNDSAPVVPGGETTFQVQLTHFEGVKGMDVTINGTAGVVFKSIASDDITLTRDDNYTLSDNQIRLVALNGHSSLTLTVTATVNADADIAVTAKLAASATQLVENVSIVNGKLTTVPPPGRWAPSCGRARRRMRCGSSSRRNAPAPPIKQTAAMRWTTPPPRSP